MEERNEIDLKDYSDDEEARYSAVLGSGNYMDDRFKLNRQDENLNI